MISHTLLFFAYSKFSFDQTGSDFNYSPETKQNDLSKDVIVYFDVFPAVSGAVSSQYKVGFHIYQMKRKDVPAALLSSQQRTLMQDKSRAIVLQF